MTRRSALTLAMTVVVLLLSFTVQEHAAVAASKQAASARLVVPKTGTNAVIRKVPVRNGQLMIGHVLQGVVYTPENGDPPCDPTGSTLYAGHAWRAGNGVADRWGSLNKGDLIKVAGCSFRVTKREFWKSSRSIRPLSRVDGPPQVVLLGCKADDYSKRTVVFAKLVKKTKS